MNRNSVVRLSEFASNGTMCTVDGIFTVPDNPVSPVFDENTHFTILPKDICDFDGSITIDDLSLNGALIGAASLVNYNFTWYRGTDFATATNLTITEGLLAVAASVRVSVTVLTELAKPLPVAVIPIAANAVGAMMPVDCLAVASSNVRVSVTVLSTLIALLAVAASVSVSVTVLLAPEEPLPVAVSIRVSVTVLTELAEPLAVASSNTRVSVTVLSISEEPLPVAS